MRNNTISLIEIKGNLIKKKKGFTLVELMVVLAIIATMTFIVVPNFTSIKTSVNEKVDKQSCEAIKRIVTTFIVDETITVSNTASTTLTYDANNKKINENNLTNKSLEDALSDVKPPRTDNTKSYKILVGSSASDVTVQVDGFERTSTNYTYGVAEESK